MIIYVENYDIVFGDCYKKQQEYSLYDQFEPKIIINSMSDNILIRRQKFARQLRRKEVESYMKNIRQKIILHRQSEQQQKYLEQPQMEQMKLKLQEQHYSSKSIESFLRNLGKYSAESLCSPYLLAILQVALMHILQWGKNQQEKDIHNLSKQIILRVIQCPINSKGKLPLQYCFKQILEILSNQDFEMLQLWNAMALIRSQIFFRMSFREFITFIEHYPGESLDILSNILQIFANFTSNIEDQHAINLAIDDLFAIISKLQLCLNQYEMGDTDIATVVLIAQNIIKVGVFQASIQLIASSSLFSQILDYLDNSSSRDLSKKTILNIIAFINNCVCGSSATTQKIIKKNQNMITILAKILPDYSSFSNFQFISLTKWSSFDKQILISVLYCFTNIAGCENSTFIMLKYGILNWFIAFSSYSDPRIREEVAIYLFNSVAVCSDQQIQILLQKNILSALNNVIRQEYSVEAIRFGLKALNLIAKASKNFPTNNLAWHFNSNIIANHCKRLNLFSYLQQLLISKSKEIQNLSANCLELLNINQEPF